MNAQSVENDAVRNVPPPVLGKTTGMKRKSISRRLRFEIFKRDGFKCVHCGASPQVGPMHLDHLKPLAEGGDESPENLVTACVDCNLGKGPVPLGLVRLRSGKATEAQREHAAQLREWLAIQKDVVQAKGEFEQMLEAEWEKRCGSLPRGIGTRLKSAVEEFGMERTMEAISITSTSRWATSETRQLQYFHGILKRFRDGTGPAKRVDPDLRPRPKPLPAPTSKHQQLGVAALHEALRDIRAAPEKYPTNGAIARHIVARAITATDSQKSLEEYEDEDVWDSVQFGLGVAIGGIHVKGRLSEDGKMVSWSVEEQAGFNPWEHAYDLLFSEIGAMLEPDPARPVSEWGRSPTAIADAYQKARELGEWATKYDAVDRGEVE